MDARAVLQKLSAGKDFLALVDKSLGQDAQLQAELVGAAAKIADEAARGAFRLLGSIPGALNRC